MPSDLLAGVTGVLFDLDDTLLDYSSARDRAVVTWAAQLGLAGDAARLVELWQELENEHFARYTSGEATMHEQRRARVRGLPGLADVLDDAADDHFATFMALTEQQWRPVPGAAEAVRRVAAQVPVGVLTNGVEAVQLRKLTHLGLSDLPLFASVATGYPKPQREAFVRACRAIDSAPATTLMVGDNLVADVMGALSAGLLAVWVDRTGRGDEPVPTIRSVSELA